MLLFLFLGMVNFGFYVYCFIQVGNAARAAAQFTAAGGGISQQLACKVALREMKSMANIAVLNPTTYDCSTITPLQVTADECAVSVGGTYTCPAPGVVTPPDTRASHVKLKYNTMLLFRLPFMTGQMEIDRMAMMRRMQPTN